MYAMCIDLHPNPSTPPRSWLNLISSKMYPYFILHSDFECCLSLVSTSEEEISTEEVAVKALFKLFVPIWYRCSSSGRRF